jgi:cysteinyl-tRNA synthetase
MRTLIEQLVTSGNAYVADDHVLFSVGSMPDYGRLSKRPLDEMIAGARVEVAPYKRDPMDFVLWKPSKPGEPAWPSPCGISAPGRPGWHIECSAMSDKWLWTEALSKLSASGRAHPHQFDIHGGGIDLVFPHHENEIAQSRSAFQTPAMANFWMHNGFLQVEGEKMSKSLGNFVTIHELLQEWPGEVIRLNMLKTHYRQPMDWTAKGLADSAKILENLYRAAGDEAPSEPYQPVIDQLADDLNTPNALAMLFVLEKMALRGGRTAVGRDSVARPPGSVLKATANLLGLLSETASARESRFREARGVESSQISSLIDARNSARKDKNFAEADRIRGELAKMGVVLKDTKDGTTWEIAR